jgi:hypothetical protein
MTDKTPYDLGLDLVGDDTPQTEHEQPLRDERGRLLPGARLPGAGRPRGLTNSEKIRALLEPERENLITSVLRLAYDGDPSNASARARALELALSRLAPPPKQEETPISIPGLAECQTVADKAACVLAAVAAGDLSIERAERVMRMLDIFQRAVSLDELRQEVEALKAGRDPRVLNPDGVQP